MRKRNFRDYENNQPASSSDEDDSESEEEERKRALDIDMKYQSSNSAQPEGPKDMGATARSEIDTEHDKDYQAQFERTQQAIREKASEEPGTSGQKVSLFIRLGKKFLLRFIVDGKLTVHVKLKILLKEKPLVVSIIMAQCVLSST
jgi:hypothetical protein